MKIHLLNNKKVEFLKDRKLLLIGLDSASPDLVFNRFKNDLPNLSKLVENGLYGNLRSSMPPITVPAWMVMFTGQNPGKLGLYGFRHRKNNSYSDIWIANSRSVTEPKLWDYLERFDKKTCLFAIPPSYPPPIVNGWSVGCFLTPSHKSEYTFPSSLKGDLENECGKYIPDLEMRTGNLPVVKDQLFKMLENHTKMIKQLLTSKKWDFFAFNEIGVDRVHHAFWRFFDETHPQYEPNSPFQNVILEYYKAIDQFIGELCEIVDDETYILVVSDHGVKAAHGAICINEWFIQEGFLTLKDEKGSPGRLKESQVDWNQTKAWGWGGYYSRVFLNVKGRENNGIIPQKDYQKELKHLQEKLLGITSPEGKKMKNLVIQPENFYDQVKRDYPDLMVVFDDLNWRISDVVGTKNLYSFEDHSTAGDAVHDWDGLFVLFDPKSQLTRGKTSTTIENIAPTVYYLLTGEKLTNLDGAVINNVKKT
jgi:predicted AlkP superfamily phosphohydrolase/phosphomutase